MGNGLYDNRNDKNNDNESRWIKHIIYKIDGTSHKILQCYIYM